MRALLRNMAAAVGVVSSLLLLPTAALASSSFTVTHSASGYPANPEKYVFVISGLSQNEDVQIYYPTGFTYGSSDNASNGNTSTYFRSLAQNSTGWNGSSGSFTIYGSGVVANSSWVIKTWDASHTLTNNSTAPPPVDVCSNIAGDQATMPSGKEDPDNDGTCTDIPAPPADVCSNIEGTQETMPTGKEDPDNDGTCTDVASGANPDDGTPSAALADFMDIFYTLAAASAALIVPIFVLTWGVRLAASIVNGRA